MNSGITQPALASVANDPVAKAGFFLLSLYFFFTYSRILDVTVPSLHLPLIIGLALYATAALAGSIQRSLGTTPGILLTVLTGIMMVAGVFGAWQGGSFGILTDHWFKAFPMYFTIVGLCRTSSQVFRFLNTLCLALGVMAFIALWRGDNLLGRLIIDNSRFADPNDLALVCLIGMSFCCFLITRKASWFSRLPAIPLLALLLYAVLRTGSRGAMLGFAAASVYLFFKSSLIGKFKMMLTIAIIAFVSAVVLPPEVYLRYVGLVSDTPEASNMQELQAAEGSADARLHLLQESLWITLRHPLLGVGCGNFAVAENNVAQSKGLRRGSWQETHNMYTQVSSENGIPAAILYIAIIVLGLKASKNVMRIAKQHPDPDTVEKAALWIRVATIAFAAAGFFLSVAYNDMLPLLCGLAIALELAVRNEIKTNSRIAQTVSRPATPSFTPAFAGMRK